MAPASVCPTVKTDFTFLCCVSESQSMKKSNIQIPLGERGRVREHLVCTRSTLKQLLMGTLHKLNAELHLNAINVIVLW